MNKMVKIVSMTLIFALSCFAGTPAFASTNSGVNETLAIPVFGEIIVNGHSQLSVDKLMENINVNDLTEQEAIDLGRDVLQKVLEDQKDGALIVWEENGVETVVKKFYPDLYSQIKPIVEESSALKVPQEYMTSANARGSKYDVFTKEYRGLVGERLYRLECSINWEWDSADVIYGVYPSSSAYTLDLLWDPVGTGIHQSTGGFSNGNKTYTHKLTGAFTMTYQDIETYAYPYMTIELTANNGAIIDSGVIS